MAEKLTNEEKVQVIEEIADENGDGFRRDYSGRGMFGSCCVGIVTDDPMGTIEEAAARGVRGACQDRMGLNVIVYWPSVKTKREEESCPS